MRYFWALLAYVTAIVVSAASCGGTGKGTGFTNTGAANTGGAGTGLESGTGGGGSTGVGITIPDSGMTNEGGPCPAYKGDCKTQGLDCGMATDGCGNVINCDGADGGGCTAPDTCGGSGTQNVCGHGPCVPGTCMSLGYDCGAASDGCGGTLTNCGTCGTGMVCGANNKPNVCGTGGTCVPKTTCPAGDNCGVVSDGCTSTISCGPACPMNQSCGGGMNPVANQCGTNCVPKTTCPAGFNCGVVSDGCQGVVVCGGACTGNQVCQSNVCGVSANCTGLCLKQTVCSGMATTSISGTVYSPNGVDPLPNTLVYVPNSAVLPFTPGVSCGSCGTDVSGSPLVSALTAFDGTFKITNMPVGTNIPLVIQHGRWRRQFVLPSVAMCVNTPLPNSGAQQLRMPRTDVVHAGGEGDIPLMGFVTGSVDALECVLRKVGIADSEFSNPSGTGRVRFYKGSGSAGSQYSAATPSETTLWGSQATINQYDMVYFACQGDDYEKTAAQQQIVVNYANSGGRVFATHYSYVWLTNTAENAVWTPTATWNNPFEGFFANDPGIGLINTASPDPRPTVLAQWLQFIGASTTYGQMQVNTLRNDFTAVAASTLLWININDPFLGVVPLHYTFDTPLGAQPANQCGRVLYSDFHVEDAVTGGTTFPNECVVAGMTPQEKMLEFMIFDLGSCVTPPTCSPATCASQNAMCGEVGDGCSNTPLMCGTCPSGQSCVSGVCQGNGCVPKTCSDQSFMCGMQGDTCGNAINCGNCPSGQTCGGNGMIGVCGTGTCNPKSCMAQGVMCGSIGDTCGNVINCGNCPAGEICGGGANPKPGICGMSTCVPKNCTQLGFNCGAASDGCGNIINCGACSGTQICGGGGSANVCGGAA